MTNVAPNDYVCDAYPVYNASKFNANLTPNCFCFDEDEEHLPTDCPRYNAVKDAILTAIQKWVESNHMVGMAFKVTNPHYGKELPSGKISENSAISYYGDEDLIEYFIPNFTFNETSPIDVEIVFNEPQFYVTSYDNDGLTGVTYTVRSSNTWFDSYECSLGDADIELSLANYPIPELKAYLPDTPKERFDLACSAIVTWHHLNDHALLKPDGSYGVDEVNAPFAILNEFSAFDGVKVCSFLQDTFAYAVTDGKRKIIYNDYEGTLYYKIPNNAGEAIYATLQSKCFYKIHGLSGYISPDNHKLTDEELDSQLVDTIAWLDDFEEVDWINLPIKKPTFKNVRDFIANLGNSCALASPSQFKDYLKSL